jgi:uncharacterized protein (DUF924 family)
MINTEEIINFWFKECDPKMWFKKKLDFDNLIKSKFSRSIDISLKTSFEDIQISSDIYLSYIIVLDQFTRNVFRNTLESFSGDKNALKISKSAIAKGFVNHKNNNYNSFFLMPLMHSENILDHELGIPFFKKYTNDNTYKFAKKHKEIIDSFGRFPHRNKILNRKSTDEEICFLKLPGSRF